MRCALQVPPLGVSKPNVNSTFLHEVASAIGLPTLWFQAGTLSRNVPVKRKGQSRRVNPRSQRGSFAVFFFPMDVMLPADTWGQCCAAASGRSTRRGRRPGTRLAPNSTCGLRHSYFGQGPWPRSPAPALDLLLMWAPSFLLSHFTERGKDLTICARLAFSRLSSPT